jgi:medium-chain acyl-[acyl-carrier-protein] hydrolase
LTGHLFTAHWLQQMHKTPWFVVPKSNPSAKVRLFCFHYGGGSSALFRDWPSTLRADIDVVAVQLPGRGSRYSEPAMRRADQVVTQVYAELVRCLDKPLVLFGYSIGALLAYEIACKLQEDRRLMPFELVVAAAKAPHLPRVAPPISQLSDEAFCSKLKTYRATPDEILDDRDLMALLLPMLRADFEMAEVYRPVLGPKLRCSVTACGGRNDPWIDEDDIRAWASTTSARFSWKMFDGDHFFIHQCERELVSQVDWVIRQHL